MRIDIHHLRLVVAVADAGSITSAAAQLGMSQPALSAQIGRIEHALGCTVFVRSREGVKLTASGDMVVERARQIITAVQRLLDDAADSERGQKAPLRVGANRSAFVASLLVELEHLLPERSIVPIVDSSSSVISDHLDDGEIDLAIIGIHPDLDPPPAAGLRQRIFVDTEPMLVAMSQDLALGRVAVDLRDLAGETWLLPPGRPDGTFAALTEAFDREGVQPHAPYGRQSLMEYWPYVAAGNAVALALPTYEPPVGVTTIPLIGNPIVGRRVVRWHPERVTEDEALACTRAAAAVYEAHLAVAAARHPWWTRSPDHRPIMADDLWE